jgi:hypothetical protein
MSPVCPVNPVYPHCKYEFVLNHLGCCPMCYLNHVVSLWDCCHFWTSTPNFPVVVVTRELTMNVVVVVVILTLRELS